MDVLINENFDYADNLFGFNIPAAVREASRFPVKVGQSDFVPEKDVAYVFRKEHIAGPIQFFASGVERNILLTGDTGCGKTSLIEQVAARLNWPVFAIGCHGGLEFQELIGRVTLKPDGSTGWADGPLIAAMRAGGIFLLDEMNFLKPEVAGGLNTILQASAYMIPETGELIKAHPDFRVAATGNAIDGVGKGAYRGTQTPNIALLNRFTLGIHMHYMDVEGESQMIRAKAPRITEEVSKLIAEIADMSRKSHHDGVLKSPISPRETVSVARRLVGYSGSFDGNSKDVEERKKALQVQMGKLTAAMEMTFMYRWSPEDKDSFLQSTYEVASRLGYGQLISNR